MNTGLIDGLVEVEEVDEVASEGVLGTESDFEALGLDVVDNFDGSLDDVLHILSMGVLPEDARSTNDDIAESGLVHGHR